MNAPIAAAAFYLRTRYLRDEPRPDRPALDLVGAALATARLAALTWGLTVASGANRLDWLSIAALGIGIALLALFLVVEQRRGAAAMLPLALFSSGGFAGDRSRCGAGGDVPRRCACRALAAGVCAFV